VSAITAYSCCCDVTPPACLPERDFRLTIQMRWAVEFYERVDVTVDDGCSDPTPPCSPEVLECVCPPFKCLETYYRSSGTCRSRGYVAHNIRTFSMLPTVIDLPYVNSTTTTDTASWVYDNAGTYVVTGMMFQGQHVVENNQGSISYDLSYGGCAGCTDLVPNNKGEYTSTLNASYVQRATYFSSPAYMTIAKPAGFVNWTWEVAANQFITRNGSGVIQNVVNLAPLTLAAARAAINALPEVIAAAIYGPIAADALPALMIENIAAQLLNVVPVQMPILQLPRGATEAYQNGIMGPRWLLGGTTIAGGTSSVAYYWKHPNNALLDFGGTEDAFCNCISTTFYDWETFYDPCIQGFNEPNFDGQCNIGTFPTWVCDCDYDTNYVNCYEQSPCAGAASPILFAFLPFGNKASACGTSQVMCSDTSIPDPTSCLVVSQQLFCDLCCNNDIPADGCSFLYRRQGWRTEKLYSIQRL